MAALITGASSGIGLELTRILAGHGHDVILVARQEDRLRTLAAEVGAGGVRAHVLAADLGAPDAAAALVARVQALGLEVDVLVNNAGFGLYGRFAETALATELSMIQLNIVVLTELTKRLLPAMVARKRGRILNVASTAAFFPGPLMAVYYATKAYVLSFSEAIANELQGSGITVTALCPGPTESGFQAAAGLEGSKLVAGRTLQTSREVAEEGYAAMMAGTPLVVTGFSNKVQVLAPRLLPRRMLASIVRAAQERRK
ncbi:MAG TPA: SDR family oxidoreductase [Vicinamibacterales bacterium]|nr:SDR family oxidoreductase [Vicinamibacterales bacterium]